VKFNPKKVAFGRHETFPLRYAWLSKGINALSKDPMVFRSEDATIELGVGKNMVSSIRYWLLATKMAELDGQQQISVSPLGEVIFGEDGFDPYLEDEGTIWLIHWMLVSNPQLSTSWFWFFNLYHKKQFTVDECSSAILHFVENNVDQKVSKSSISQDMRVMLRMYSRSKGLGKALLEDILDSPLSTLGLVNRDTKAKRFTSFPEERADLPLGVFGYAVLDTMANLGVKQMPTQEMMYNQGVSVSPGASFRLTENALISMLESLVRSNPESFELRETAGLHQFYLLDDIEPLGLLENHYSDAAYGRLAA
jgi:hypothetical protein